MVFSSSGAPSFLGRAILKDGRIKWIRLKVKGKGNASVGGDGNEFGGGRALKLGDGKMGGREEKGGGQWWEVIK